MHIIKKGVITILAFVFLIQVGCGVLPSPSSLISSPQYKYAEQDPSYQTEAMVKQHLPEGTTLYIPENPVGAEAIRVVDMDYDGCDEIAATYKYTDKNKGTGCIILMKQKDGWVKKFDEMFHIDKLNWVAIDDFTGDKNLEVMIGLGLSDYFIMRIYSFGDEAEVVYKGEYSFLKLLENVDNEQKSIALLTKKDNTYANGQPILGYYGKIMRWDGDGFSLAEDIYPDHYSELEPFYRQEFEKSNISVIANYYFAEWMVNCNRPDKALELIETIKKDESIQYKNYVIKTGILEAQALSELARYEEAGEKMQELINGIEEGKYAFMSYKLPYIYLILGRNCNNSGQPEKAKEMFEKSIVTNNEFLLNRYEENRFWQRMANDELEEMN